MRSKHRPMAYALGLAAALASVTYGGLPAAAAGSTATSATPAAATTGTGTAAGQPTWKAAGMVEEGQTICTRPTVGQRSLVLIRLVGSWPQLATDTNNLPAGSSVSTYPIYPGSNDSPTQISSAINVLLPALPLGTKRSAEVEVTDGVHTQTIPFHIVVTEDCTGFRL
ncbi:hypothetical protein EDC02_1412 [Micromonospora sp. Llam0]|uniref:DUF5980 family protein n=1 Tax=Micromonospora sp. Llam0 TaxID=2485143 RepID=UPI000F9D2B80|nr:DUF5980 family protein [Micromonospora sp. Llam0]ROO59611.1 hypothetical protein EDC02_1412 [Micromonospora sp. Llam0]